MNAYVLSKPILLALLFIKEQLKEPVALFWTVISPVVTYYLISYTRAPVSYASTDYMSSTSWFYAFVSSSVAFFGLAFYIVGRRESGFLRSFVYTTRTKIIFLAGQFVAYSFVSLVYCSVFYVLTRQSSFQVAEYLVIIGRFYIFPPFLHPFAFIDTGPRRFSERQHDFFNVIAGNVGTRHRKCQFFKFYTCRHPDV